MSPDAQVYTYSTVLMGSPILLKLFVHDEPLVSQVFRCIKQQEDLLTVNRAHSEVMAINQAAGKHPVVVSQPVFNLIKRAREVSLLEGSCFNFAIGPVVKCWKIGFQGHSVPPADELRALLALTDPHHVVLNAQDCTVWLEKAGMEIDLGAIAKGYIADVVRQFLYQHHVYHALINLGGNVLALGRPQNGGQAGWAVGLQKPFGDNGELIGVIHVANKSVVTSGIYERYFECDGRLYHHILDPKTGYPLDNELLSVTIISDASIDGDIYTTLIYGLGVEKGMAYLSRLPHIDAIFVTKDRRVILSSPQQYDFTLLDAEYEQVVV
ncbi:FAD:protein FMN transferase [Dickeya undicola]|uniref:FAD:protein FMN transferase n=1 Tax=Dickeya undicola TaxID=1577887 RepID=A0A3N0G0L7_9GAMM|nr:FAD:protein FMN transferase [Dickeya undicola]RNM05752.1 FAD:protein FMN transferase [Dickeya undicola]RNM19714.1 FAD:protein FMN transferase [Dickeya undicola]